MASTGNVLILVENLSVPFDRRVWMEATTLQREGYDVSVICPKMREDEADHEVLEGVRIHRHPVLPDISSTTGYLWEYTVALFHEFRLAWKLSRERRFDVVHVCNPPDLLFLVALFVKMRSRASIIFDQHDLNPEMYEAKFGRRDIFYYGLRVAERLTFASADTVISTNESYREIAVQRGKKKPERVFVVRSGPDLERFRSAKANERYRRRRFLVGYVGVMGEPEGIDYLLRAIDHIVRDLGRTDIHFMLIGGGPAVEDLRNYTRDLGLEDYVEFTGRVPDGELEERLSTADVCVDPGPKNPFNDKSTMNKILEYMALAKPIVQFDLQEGRRSAAGASLYAQANDEKDFAKKLLGLLDDEALRQRMGNEGKRRMVEELEWRHQAPQLLKAYETTLSS